jgi:GntR family transcriptional regulator
MNSKNKNGLPAYRKIQQVIQRRIESGDLKQGDAIASERELARQYKVSLMTARNAVRELELEGLVERRRGTGTFIAPPKIHFNKLTSFTEQMASRGFSARTRTLDATMVEAEYDLVAKLALPASSKVLKLERIRLAGSQPFAVEVCYLPGKPFELLLKRPLENRSLFALLEQEFGVRLAYADEEVDATIADARIAEHLGVSHHFPVLRIRQVLYDAEGKPIVYTLAFYRADRYTLHTRRFR